jgi:hypothetical protein
VFQEHYKDCTLASVNTDEKVGEWKYYLPNGALRAVAAWMPETNKET